MDKIVRFLKVEDGSLYYESLQDAYIEFDLYSEHHDEITYSSHQFLIKGMSYFVSHPSLFCLDSIKFRIKYYDGSTDIIELTKDILKGQKNHILNFYTESEYNSIKDNINWSFYEIFVTDHYGIKNISDKFFHNIKTVIDLGANIGTFGKYLRYRGSQIENYIAVEPNKRLLQSIENNIGIIPNLVIHKNGFGDYERKSNLNIIQNSKFDNETSKVYDQSILNEKNLTEYPQDSIEMKTFHTIMSPYESVDILKVDIEGMEESIIHHDNYPYLKKVKMILLECHSNDIRDNMVEKLSEEFDLIGENNDPGLPHLIFRRKDVTIEKDKKILIKISCPALGDTLCSTPTVRKASESYGQKVDVMTKRPDVFENNMYVSNVLEYTDNDVEGYDEVFETYNQHIKINKNMGDSDYYEKPMEIKLSNFEARQLHALGLGITLYPDEMSYDYVPKEQTDISKMVDKNYIVLHVTENWPVRTWSISKWQKLVDLIKSETDYKIVTIGKAHKEDGYFGKIDKNVVKLNNIDLDTCLYENVGRQDHVQLGEGSLSELWHIINNAKMLISFDSGPIHLAGTTDTHIIQIGSSIRYEKTAPYRNGSQLYKFYPIMGGCDLFCATNPKYSVKEWGTINSMPYYPKCQEGYKEFKCQPTVEQIFKKIKEI